jgi:hypothetical protein
MERAPKERAPEQAEAKARVAIPKTRITNGALKSEKRRNSIKAISRAFGSLLNIP